MYCQLCDVTTRKDSELLTKHGIVPESCCPFAIKTDISVFLTDRAGSEPDILSSTSHHQVLVYSPEAVAPIQ